MGSVHLRDRRQITLPTDIVTAAGLQTDDVLQVSYVNGVIQLVPSRAQRQRADIRRFLGACGTVYGQDAEAMNQYLRDERDSW